MSGTRERNWGRTLADPVSDAFKLAEAKNTIIFFKMPFVWGFK